METFFAKESISILVESSPSASWWNQVLRQAKQSYFYLRKLLVPEFE